jgi:beta-lactamase class A
MQKQKQILTKHYVPEHLRPVQTRRVIRRTRPSSYVVAAHEPVTVPAVEQHRQSHKARLHWPLVRIASLVLIVGLVFGYISAAQHAAAEIASQKAQAAAVAAEHESTFGSKVQPLLNGSKLTTDVAVALPDRPVKNFGSDGSFDGASTGKLLTAADYLHKVDTHKASLTQMIDGSTAQALLQKMLVDSDDSAWEQLNNYLGHDDLSRYAASVGFKDYHADTNTFPAGSVAGLLQSIYGGHALSSGSRSMLLGYMESANHREFMVQGIPADVRVYHKIGMDGDNIHDAMIIEKDGHWAVVVMFTDGHGTYDWGDRALLMQQVAAAAASTLL